LAFGDAAIRQRSDAQYEPGAHVSASFAETVWRRRQTFAGFRHSTAKRDWISEIPLS
jgi:hypothetical protein